MRLASAPFSYITKLTTSSKLVDSQLGRVCRCGLISPTSKITTSFNFYRGKHISMKRL